MTATADVSQQERPALTRSLVWLMAVASGVAVANLYYVQPLVAAIRDDLKLSATVAGLVVTLTQLGYAAGLILLLPLGDMVERRRLIVGTGLVNVAALLLVGAAPTEAVLLPAAVLVGALSVQAQLLVPLAASLASDGERGRVVGTVISGLLLGILLARTVAGLLAETGSWRLAYFAAAGLMLVQSAVLRARLPRWKQHAGLSYRGLLASTVELFRDEAVLRRRALYGLFSFASFSVLWTSVAFLLSGAGYHYSVGLIGAFGLVGAVGALSANLAGRLADQGRARATTLVGAVTLVASWLFVAAGQRSDGGAWWHLAALIVGVVVLDAAVQAMQVTNQSEIYSVRPEARGRITAACITSYFIGGAMGSAVSAWVWGMGGWTAVSLLGAGFSLALLLAVLVGERGSRRA